MDVKTHVGRMVQWLFLPRCLLCDGRGQFVAGWARDLCGFCQRQLPYNSVACVRCALPMPAETSTGRVCGKCQKQPPQFDASFSMFRYQQPVVWLVQQLKFNERLVHARLLGDLFSERIMCELASGQPCPQGILPVPLHKQRLRQRGFNQSIELARSVAANTGIELMLDHVERVRPTEAQTGLDAGQRRKNIRGAFEVVKSIPFQHVAVLDDVVTTGSTVNELARALKKAGVRRVDVWSIARAE